MSKLTTIWNAVRKAGSTLVDRVIGPSAAKVEAKVVTAPRVGNYDDAFKTSQSLGQLTELGLVEPKKFAQSAKAVLDSPQSGNFASEVTRHTAGALKDNPNSPELVETLAKGHKQLDKNISERMQRAKLMDDPGELSAIHTNNIRDARTIIDTGAPKVLREDAFKDIAKSLDGLMATDPAAARRITMELSKDPVMMKGVGDAARAMRASEAAAEKAHATAAVAKPAPAKPQITDMDHAWADERLRNLGVIPRTPTATAAPAAPAVHAAVPRLPELSLVDDAVPLRAGATSYPAGAPAAGTGPTGTFASITQPRQLSDVEVYAARMQQGQVNMSTPNVLRPVHVEGMEVRDIDMSVDAFKALLAEPVKGGKPAAAAATARPTTLSH